MSKIGDDSDSKDEDLFEFEFYTGGKNQKFDDHMRGLGLSTSNLEFLDFIQSELGEQILQNNKLKIHIDTGNIYYDNKDTNKSIFSFVLNQQSPIHGIINYDLMYNRSYKNYFDWIFNWFVSYQNTKLDLLTFKNSKFLFYRFNDLLNQSNRELKKIKHSFVTNDYIAAEEIPNQN